MVEQPDWEERGGLFGDLMRIWVEKKVGPNCGGPLQSGYGVWKKFVLGIKERDR